MVPNPGFPSYSSNAAVLGTASALTLGYLFPCEAARYRKWVHDFGESRLWAGIHFRSDLESGQRMGWRIATAVIDRAQGDGAE